MSRPPLWYRMCERAERAVAPRLEAGVRTGKFASTLAMGTKVGAELSRREALSGQRVPPDQLSDFFGRIQAGEPAP